MKIPRFRHDNWLPRPKGKVTDRTRRACDLFVELHGPRPMESAEQCVLITHRLNALLSIMTQQELAEYYAYVQRVIVAVATRRKT